MKELHVSEADLYVLRRELIALCGTDDVDISVEDQVVMLPVHAAQRIIERVNGWADGLESLVERLRAAAEVETFLVSPACHTAHDPDEAQALADLKDDQE